MYHHKLFICIDLFKLNDSQIHFNKKSYNTCFL